MRPWTTRTMQATLMAAGFATLGTATATAAPNMDALPEVPEELSMRAPVDSCNSLPPTHRNLPCLNGGLAAHTPNPVGDVANSLQNTSTDAAQDMIGGKPPLAAGQQAAGDLVRDVTKLAGKATQERPSVEAGLEPRNTTPLIQQDEKSGLLHAGVGPRAVEEPGVSAADTPVELTAAKGYSLSPQLTSLQNPSAQPAPKQGNSAPVDNLLGQAPALSQVPALGEATNKVTQPVEDLAGQAGGLTENVHGLVPQGALGKAPQPAQRAGNAGLPVVGDVIGGVPGGQAVPHLPVVKDIAKLPNQLPTRQLGLPL